MSKRLVTEASYRGWFLLLSIILIILSVWSWWDEMFARRPWKDYQGEYYKQKYTMAKKEYDDLLMKSSE